MIFRDQSRRSLHWAEAFGASAVVHLGLAIFTFDLLDDFNIFEADPPPEPEIVVTSIILDGELIPTPQEPLTNDPLSETPTEGEEDPYEDPDPVSTAPDEVEPEETEPDEAEELEPVTAETPELEPQTLAPITEQAALAPQPISPLRPQDGTAIPVAPVASAAVAAPSTPDRIAPTTATALQPLNSLPPRPEPQATALAPAPDGPAAGGAVSEIVSRIRGRLSDPCLLAIPLERPGGVPELVMIGVDEISMQVFADAVLADLTPVPDQRNVLVDPRQCAALNFVRENAAYPAFRLSATFVQADIQSGDQLTGTIGNTAGRYVSLLLVDDNGVVQDIGNILSFTGRGAEFSELMTRQGGARDTSPVLIALATASRPGTLDLENGQLADQFFVALREELGPNTPLVLVPFNVR